MPNSKTQLQRLIFIDREIRAGMKKGKLANCKTMAEAYEVSGKTIMRDIDYLKHQCEAPLLYDRAKHGYYYTEENYRLPAMEISESDLLAICLTRKIMEQHRNTPIYGKLASVFAKIEKSLPERITISPDWIDNRMSVLGDNRSEIDPSIWQIVAEALHRLKGLELVYLKPGEEATTKRQVDPYHSVSFQGEWYLIGFCHLRKGIRTFAISRIKTAEVMKNTFMIPGDFDPEDFIDRRFGLFRSIEPRKIEILFSIKAAPYIREREWHPDQTLDIRENGEVLLSFSTRNLFGVKRWILSWGSEAEVLSPEDLRDELYEELRKSLQAYGQ